MTAIHVKFYALQRYDEQSSFKNVCPVCLDGILLMCRDNDTGQLLENDSCVLCGQTVIYDDIEEVRVRHGW